MRCNVAKAFRVVNPSLQDFSGGLISSVVATNSGEGPGAHFPSTPPGKYDDTMLAGWLSYGLAGWVSMAHATAPWRRVGLFCSSGPGQRVGGIMDSDRLFERYRELQSYVGWTEADAERIAAAAPLLEPYLLALIDDFYDEIERHPERARSSPAARRRSIGSRARWSSGSATCSPGPTTTTMSRRRWRVGWRHVEIGLEQVYTNVALSRLRTGLVGPPRELARASDGRC